jgi:outer membrane receptor protein involved in Fe transport
VVHFCARTSRDHRNVLKKPVLAGLLPALFLATMGTPAQAPPGRISGSVTGPGGGPLPGVLVTLIAEDGTILVEVTGARGGFMFGAVPPGDCRLIAVLPAYEAYVTDHLAMASGQEVNFDIVLQIARIAESVMVRDVATRDRIADPEETSQFDPQQLDALPLPTDRFQEALPLVPGVLRDPEGRISFNGARPSQSMLLVNGANVTDPVTGEFAAELPLKAIDEVEINSLPYLAEYGRVTGAVARITTRGGNDEFDIDVGDFWPRPNFRDGTIKGIRSWVPQVQVSGPIKKGKAWFSQGIAYRFARSRVFDVEQGEDERILENFDSFTQLDLRFAEKHHLTTTFSFFPVEVDNFGLSALVTSDASPELESGGWNLAFSQRSFFSQTLVETMVAAKTYNLTATPMGEGPSRLIPDGLRDNYFNFIDRESTRFEIGSAITHSPRELWGQHLAKFGANISYTSFSGVDAGLPIEFYSESGQRLQRIDFVGDPTVAGEDLQASAYVQDQWRPNHRVGIDLGLRYDFDRLASDHQIAPRISGAVAVDARGRTVIKGGVGVFYDHVFLHADRYETLQSRVETSYSPDGLAVGAPVVLQPRIAREGLEMPRSTTWNIELGQRMGDSWQLRVSYRERRGAEEFIVDRVEPETDGEPGSMLLSSDGSSLTREMDVTVHFARNDNELYASYVRARTTGDLNDFNTLYQNLRSPLFLDNESSLYALDVPHRALVWGVWKFPGDVIVSPGIEWRLGYPYTVFAEDYTPVGERNRGGRFPNFFSADVRVTKGITIAGRKLRVGFQIFNLGSHFNPRDVISNLDSSRFGEFLNGVDMGVSLRLSLGI